ncbi:MAG TPA: peptidylprolyl isomerase [Polyangiaceae bacterium]|nr:peptidylprolyl isomerase [Polyangiaceae bacterium]
MRGIVASLFVVVLVGGCGRGSADPSRSTAPKEGQASSAEAQCLADAAAAREPKADAPPRIEVAHILVRHQDLARPEGATRSKGEACLRALAALDALKAGKEWEAVYAEYSDEKSATEGNLGSVSKDDLDPAFAAAAFALDVNELSYVVETERGFHVIVRLE